MNNWVWVGGFVAGAAGAWVVRSRRKRERTTQELEEMAEAELLDELLDDNTNAQYREVVRRALAVFPGENSGPRIAFEACVKEADYEALQHFISWVRQGPDGEAAAARLEALAPYW